MPGHARFILRYFVPGSLVLAVGWGMGALLFRDTARPAQPAPPISAAGYDAALLRLNGSLSPAAIRISPAEATRAGWGGYTVALVRSADWRSCEDLGRQLRELQRVIPANSVMLVWTESDDLQAVRRRLRREKIRARVAAVSSLDRIFAAPQPIATPAVLRVSPDGAHAWGVAHTRRFPNVRQRSFAYELGLLAGTDIPHRTPPTRGFAASPEQGQNR